MMVNRCLVPSCNPNYHSRRGSIATKKTKKSCCLRTKKNVLLGWMLFRLRGKLTRKIIPIRETLAKFFFLCNSVEEGQGETKRSPSVWPDHQHILYPSCRPARPPKQRLTKRASLTVCNMQPDKLPLFLQQDRETYQSIKGCVPSGCKMFRCSTK